MSNKINSIVDEVYVCNLKKRKDRMKAITKDFGERGISFTRWEAIDGSKLKGIKEGANRRYNKYAEALVRTFKQILEDAKAKGHKRILFFEDDVCFIQEVALNIELDRIQNLPEFDFFFLGTLHSIPKRRVANFDGGRDSQVQIQLKGTEFKNCVAKIADCRKEHKTKKAELESKLKELKDSWKLKAHKLESIQAKRKKKNLTDKEKSEVKKLKDAFLSERKKAFAALSKIEARANKEADKANKIQDEIKLLSESHNTQESLDHNMKYFRLAQALEIRACHAMIISSRVFDDLIAACDQGGLVMEEFINPIVAKGDSYCFTKNVAFQSSGFSDIAQKRINNKEFHS